MVSAFWFCVFRFGLLLVGRWNCCSGGFGVCFGLQVVCATRCFLLASGLYVLLFVPVQRLGG